MCDLSHQKTKEEVFGLLTHSFLKRNHPLPNIGLNWSPVVMPPKKKPLKNNTPTAGENKEDQLSQRGGAELDNDSSKMTTAVSVAVVVTTSPMLVRKPGEQKMIGERVVGERFLAKAND